MSTAPKSGNPLRTNSKKTTSPRSTCLELLEPRCVLSAPTLTDLDDAITISAGAPVQIALGGSDTDGDALTYTVTSSNSDISVSIPKQEAENGHRSLRITVQGYGEMVFELFEDLAPETTARIIEIVESGWYEDRVFHRIIDGFMIQGGSADGDGTSGTGTTFNDEYSSDLQFTTSGLLAMAKSLDDTNDSQFFITDVPSGDFSLPRWLDFNYTIFGKLTSGDDVREAISEVETDSDDYPADGDIVIESMEIFYDDQNAVMMISAPDDYEGSSDITITVTDEDGNTATETIAVTVEADEEDNLPYMTAIDPIRLTVDEPYTFQLEAVDVEGDTIYYSAELLTDTDDITVEITDEGLVTITPSNEVIGVAEVAFRVGATADSLVPDSDGDYDESIIDVQIVTISIPPLAPTIGFVSGADTGVKDGVTAVDNSDGKELYFEIGNLQAASSLSVYLNGVEVPYVEVTRIPAGDGTSNYVATIQVQTGAAFDDGDYTLHVQQTLDLTGDYEGQQLVSDLSEAFDFTIDTAAPVITSDAIDYAFQDEDYFYDVDSDDEGEGITYEIQMPIPDGMSINAETGEITWVPTSDVGYEQPVVILATDGAGNEGRQSFTITIFTPMDFTVEGDQTVDELETVSLIITASDPADLTSTLTITLRDGVLSADANYSLEQLDENSARFTWYTTEADGPGIYDLVFSAENSSGATAREVVQVTVSEVNQTPAFTEVFDEWEGTEGESIEFEFVASDDDLPANELVFDLFGDVPDGAVIDETSGLFSWTPDEESGGQSYEFGVRVTDSGGLAAEQVIVINVAENQQVPVFDPVAAQEVVEGEVLDFVVAATDPDIPTHAIRYELEGEVPDGLAIDAETGRIRWEVPESYVSLSELEKTFELTVVAREVVDATEVGQFARQTVEVTVVDSLADLINDNINDNDNGGGTAPLTPAEKVNLIQAMVAQTTSSSGMSLPLEGPQTVSLASTSLNWLPDDFVSLESAEILNDEGFFGIQFGPTGASGGDGESEGNSESNPEGENGEETPAEGEETSSLNRLLDEIAGEGSQNAVEALLAVDSSPENRTDQPAAEPQSDEQPAEPQKSPNEEQAADGSRFDRETPENEQQAAAVSDNQPAEESEDDTERQAIPS